MTGFQILQIIRDGDVLGLNGTQKVLHDRVGVVSKADFDRSLETMDITIVARPLIGLMLLHQWDQRFGVPALHLEVIIVGG